jgi:hypothetical protein
MDRRLECIDWKYGYRIKFAFSEQEELGICGLFMFPKQRLLSIDIDEQQRHLFWLKKSLITI